MITGITQQENVHIPGNNTEPSWSDEFETFECREREEPQALRTLLELEDFLRGNLLDLGV